MYEYCKYRVRNEIDISGINTSYIIIGLHAKTCVHVSVFVRISSIQIDYGIMSNSFHIFMFIVRCARSNIAVSINRLVPCKTGVDHSTGVLKISVIESCRMKTRLIYDISIICRLQFSSSNQTAINAFGYEL